MPSLKEQLSSDPQKRKAVVEDALRVLDAEVADKAGITGFAIRSAFSVVKGIKPGFIPEVVDNLLDQFVDALDPIYQDALAKGIRPAKYLEDNRGRMADDLLAITDKRAEKTKFTVLRSGYNQLRGTAKKHVEASATRLGQMLERHAATS